MTYKRTCEHCGTEFETKRRDARFCPGKPCRARWHREHNSDGKVTGISAGTNGWYVTVYCPNPPKVQMGTLVNIVPAAQAKVTKSA